MINPADIPVPAGIFFIMAKCFRKVETPCENAYSEVFFMRKIYIFMRNNFTLNI